MAQRDASAPVALHKFRYCALPLESVTSVLAEEDGVLPVKQFRFALPDGQRSGLATGHHLVVGAELDGHLVTRKYTPVSAPSQTGWIDLLVKIYPSGVMSRHVDSLAPGDTLDVKGPAGYFRYPSGGLPGARARGSRRHRPHVLHRGDAVAAQALATSRWSPAARASHP